MSGFTSCTYSVDEWMQITATAPTNWTIYSTVDGNFLAGGPFLGIVDEDLLGDFTANSWSEYSGRRFGPGNHTIQTFAFMRDAPGNAFHYQFNY